MSYTNSTSDLPPDRSFGFPFDCFDFTQDRFGELDNFTPNHVEETTPGFLVVIEIIVHVVDEL